ncbi:reverse transcriptase domain-containing protein [Tanacetum coccineum]
MKDLQHSFRNSDENYHDPEKCEHAGEDENAEDVQIADHLGPMEELLRIPILGIENAIIVPAILADQFDLKPELLDFVRAAETWLENEPSYSITTWDDLVSKFLNRFFPHSKTRQIRKEIMNFQQVFGETFIEDWERFKDLLRKCPHHGFSLLHQIDFFYNGLCQFDQDSLNTAAGGNLMTRNTQDALTIIENKARVRTCRNKPQVSSSGGTSTKIDAITVLTKQVEALEYQLMQNQIGQMEEIFQKRQSCVLPSNTNPPAEHKVITSTDGLTLDGSFLSHSNFLEKDQEPETITKVVEIASSKSTPLVPPLEIPPLSAPKPKEDPKPNPYQPPIPYPCRLQEENFQALKNPTGREPPDTILMEDEEIKLNPLKDSDDSVPIPRYEHSDEPETKTIMDEVHTTIQIPPLFEGLTFDKSTKDIILHQIRHGVVNSSRLTFYLDLLSPEDNFGSLSSDSFELGDQNVVFDPGIFFINGVFSFIRKLHIF